MLGKHAADLDSKLFISSTIHTFWPEKFEFPFVVFGGGALYFRILTHNTLIEIIQAIHN